MLSKINIPYAAGLLACVFLIMMLFSLIPTEAAAVAVTGVSGVEVTVDSNGSISESSGTVTATVKGSFTTRKTTTITVTNTSGSTATISFDYTVSNHDSSVSTIDDLAGADSGSYSVLLTAGATKTFTMCSKRFTSNTTGTATLKNFKVATAAAESDVTVTYGSLGSVKLDGTAIASGSVNKVSSSTGASFVAVPGSGSKFVAWINPTNNAVLSTSATYQFVPAEAMTIRAVFANASAAPVFFADGTTKVLESLDAAISYASSASNKVITLASDATLSAGNYTIPAGITVNIPYDAAGTLCTTEPTKHENKYTKPSVFRKLTLASGANITVNGTLSVSGMQSTQKRNNGSPSGPVGFISMNSNSSIAVNEGALLYVWGYITGSGSVIINSGGTLYESFQITDYRGGDATTEITSKDDEYGVFPFNQYYVQNVEVPLTIHAGANEYCTSFVTVSLGLGYMYQPLNVPFIGEEGTMFTLDSGYLVKDYIEGTGRTEIKVFGNMIIQEVSLSMKVSMIGDITIDSSKYALPIPNHMTVILSSGNLSLNQSIALLPGSELYVEEGTNATLGAGKKVYIYDWAQWNYNDGANGYSGTTNLPYIALNYVPGGDGVEGRLKDALVQVDGIVDATKGAIYVTDGGANIYSTDTGVINLIPGTETVAYQVITSGTDISSWPEITLLPAVLRDAGDTYVSANVAGKYKYYASTGKWDKPGHRYEATVVTPTCTENGYTAHTCIACQDRYTDTEVNALGHSYENNSVICSVCSLFEFYASNVHLGNSLDMMFAFPASAFVTNADLVGYYVKVVRTYADGSTEESKIDASSWSSTKINNVDYYVVIYKGFAAKEMCDSVSLTVCRETTSEEKELSTVWTDSIQQYAMRMLSNHSDNQTLCTLLVDMLNYGSACQREFDYDTTNLANEGLSNEQKTVDPETIEWSKDMPSGSDIYETNLIVKSNIRFAVSGADGSSSFTFYNHWVTGNPEYPETLIRSGCMIPNTQNDYYYINKLFVADARQVITIKVGETTFEDSVEAYCYRMIHNTDATETQKAVCTAFMKFSDSAYNYLHDVNKEGRV